LSAVLTSGVTAGGTTARMTSLRTW
jgi:hypothetical protein